MNRIKTNKFGIAVGSTFALLYLACIISVMIVGKDGIIFVMNTIFHVIDITPLIKTTISLSSMIIGLFEIFIIGWLIGVTIASIYNIGE